MVSSLLTASRVPLSKGTLSDWIVDRSPVTKAVNATSLISPLVSLIVDYLEVQKKEPYGIFGGQQWIDHFSVTVPAAPPLPSNIEEILQSQCPIFPGKKTSETHTFVYIPETVNGLPLTLKHLGSLVKKYFPQWPNGYLITWPDENLLNKSIDYPSYWALMTNEAIPRSKGLKWHEQQTIVNNLKGYYEIPNPIETVVSVLARFALFKIRLFSDHPVRCRDAIEINCFKNYRAIVHFPESGLLIFHDNYNPESISVAAIRIIFEL